VTPSGRKRTDLIDPRVIKVCAFGGFLGYFGTLAAVMLFGAAGGAHRVENGIDVDQELGFVAAIVPFVNGFTGVLSALFAYFLILREAGVRDALPTLAGGYLAGTAVVWLAQFAPLAYEYVTGPLIYAGGILGLLIAATVRRCVPAARKPREPVALGELRLPKMATLGAGLGYFGTLFGAGLSALFAEVLGTETHVSATFLVFLGLYGPLVNAATGALGAAAAYFSLLGRLSFGAAAARIAAGYVAGTLVAWSLQLTPPGFARFVDWLVFAGGIVGVFAAALAQRWPPPRAGARS
jgi:hypothetical protein